MATSVGETASSLSKNFMTLLVEQLRHQDPLEPVANNEMTMQLAQLSSLEQLESMNGSFKQVLASQQKLQAAELIGKEISWRQEDTTLTSGRVSGIAVTSTGILLKAGGVSVALDDVEAVQN